MPSAPGIVNISLNAPPPGPAGPRTGVWFVTGVTQRGAVGVPLSIQSMTQFAAVCGARIPQGILYDCVDVFFREGGSQVYVSRLVGPAAAVATIALKDTATTPETTLNVNANSPGVWGNALTCAVVAGSVANTFQLVIAYNGLTVETSPNCTQPSDAVAWSSVSNYVSVVAATDADVAPTNNPAIAAATALTGGLDDNTTDITEAIWTAGLAAFGSDLGPGQVSAPGHTTTAGYAALWAHAIAYNRTAVLDDIDSGVAATVITNASGAQAQAVDPSYGAYFAPWLSCPGLPTGTALPAPPRIVPASCAAAALMARSDTTYANPNLAAAGANGALGFVNGVTQTYVASDRALLNNAGVNVFRNFANSGVQLYGFRSLAIDPTWVQLSNQRLRMAIFDEADTIAAAIAEFGQVDGQGHYFSKLAGALNGMLQQWWAIGALYGATASAAFVVNVGPSVNTPATEITGNVYAVISARMSPFAEFVTIELVRVPITQAV